MLRGLVITLLFAAPTAHANSWPEVWSSFVTECGQSLLDPRGAATSVDYAKIDPSTFAVSEDQKMVTLTTGRPTRFTLFSFAELNGKIASTCSMTAILPGVQPADVQQGLQALNAATIVGGYQPAIVPNVVGQMVKYDNYTWLVSLPEFEKAGASVHVQHDTHGTLTLTGFGQEQ